MISLFNKHRIDQNKKYHSAITLSEGVKLQSSLVFSEIRLDLDPWVHVVSFWEKYTSQSLWEKLVAWPRCISRQYVGKVGEKAWKMPWEISGSPLGSLRLGWWTRWDFIGQGVILSLDGGAEARDDWVPKKSKGKRWLGPIIAAFSFSGSCRVGRTRETHITHVPTHSSF